MLIIKAALEYHIIIEAAECEEPEKVKGKPVGGSGGDFLHFCFHNRFLYCVEKIHFLF